MKTNNLLFPTSVADPAFHFRILPFNLIRILILPLTHFLQNHHLRPPPFLFDADPVRNTASYHYTVSIFYTPRSRTGLALKWRRLKLSLVLIIATINAMSIFYSLPYLLAVLWIRIGYNANPDLTFCLNPDPDQWSQTNANPSPDPGQTLKSQNVEFFQKNIGYLK